MAPVKHRDSLFKSAGAIAGKLLSVVVLLAAQAASPQARPRAFAGGFASGGRAASAARSSRVGGRQQASELYFLSPRVGWALSNGGLYRTTDGGGTWEALNRHEAKLFSKLVFVSEQDGWAVSDEWATDRRSNSVFRTQDGGRSWVEVLTVPTPVYSVAPVGHTQTYVTSRWYPNKLTADGGGTWEDVRGLEGLNYVLFLNERDGWGYGAGIWRTSDGGKSWESVVAPAALKGELYSAGFADAAHGWIVGSNRQVWRTTDGKTWQQVSGTSLEGRAKAAGSKADVNFYSVSFTDTQNGWVAAQDGSVLRSADGGVSWSPACRLSEGVNAVSFTTRRDGWLLTDGGGLLHTTDGGENWESLKLS